MAQWADVGRTPTAKGCVRVCETGGGEVRFKDTNPCHLISNIQPGQGLVFDPFVFFGTIFGRQFMLGEETIQK